MWRYTPDDCHSIHCCRRRLSDGVLGPRDPSSERTDPESHRVLAHSDPEPLSHPDA
jgi:hypothetical protein